jgi:hypothetical protein
MEQVNRLGSATSPYLLQHKDNPVDWWEWSDEAFAEARRLDQPILLSVGYAACHWCHGLMLTGGSGLQRWSSSNSGGARVDEGRLVSLRTGQF